MQLIPITKEEDKKANEESIYLYGYLRKKYCNENVSDLDIILNSLCFSILRLIHHHVSDSEREVMIDKIIIPILKNGIKNK